MPHDLLVPLNKCCEPVAQAWPGHQSQALTFGLSQALTSLLYLNLPDASFDLAASRSAGVWPDASFILSEGLGGIYSWR